MQALPIMLTLALLTGCSSVPSVTYTRPPEHGYFAQIANSHGYGEHEPFIVDLSVNGRSVRTQGADPIGFRGFYVRAGSYDISYRCGSNAVQRSKMHLEAGTSYVMQCADSMLVIDVAPNKSSKPTPLRGAA